MSPVRSQFDPLVKASNLNLEPAFKRPCHVCADPAARDVSPIRMSPFDPPKANVRAEPNESVPREPVQVEFQSILETNPVTLSRHLGPFPSGSLATTHVGSRFANRSVPPGWLAAPSPW
jgi:hypothetical protein